MLTFFRRIRKGLLEGGATRNYLLYAVGEILLVMIGILLALQVNNWNEWRKDRVKERVVLSEIAKTLEENIELLESAVESLDVTNNSSKIVLSVWENKTAYSDSLEWHLFRSQWSWGNLVTGLSTAGYEALKNTGYDVIINDTLRGEIVFAFETTIPEIRSEYTSSEDYKDHELMRRNFLFGDGGYVPINYDRIMHDEYYYSIIHYMRNMRNTHIRWTKRVIDEIEIVLQLIKDELGESD